MNKIKEAEKKIKTDKKIKEDDKKIKEADKKIKEADKETIDKKKMVMDMQIFEASEVSSKKGRKKSTEKFAEYAMSFRPHKKWLLKKITKSKDGTVRIKLAEK